MAITDHDNPRMNNDTVMAISASRNVDARPVRTKATAFDAARSGSWHYYSPQPRKRTASTSGASTPDPSPGTAAMTPGTTSTTIPQQTFDAANPATWNRSNRVLPVSMLRPSLSRSISEDPGTDWSLVGRQPPTRNPATRSLQEWNNYLSMGGVGSRERADILADVLLALRHEARVTSTDIEFSRRPRETRSDAVPQRRTSILDDPDFGDTSVYWNSFNDVGRSTEPTRLAGVNLSLNRARDQRTRLHTMTRPSMPRQPTHLNYHGITPQQATVRRRPSTASISSLASRGSLPEYSAAILDGQHALPTYRARASTEIQV